MTDTPRATAAVLLVGAHGFGAVHLRNLERLGSRIQLVALADPKGGPAEGFGSNVPSWPTLDAALDSGVRPDIVIVATPTNTHFALAARALEAGSDVYLEKPPVATMEQFTELLALQERTGRAIQVGFQSFGSHALAEIATLGTPSSVATWAHWSRDRAYWTRSAWAGRRVLNGQPVVDGVLTNAISHAIATALHIAGARRREDIADVELELYRAAEIEADDTSSVRITLADGRIVTGALTLASAELAEPLIEVRTPGEDVTFSYTTDDLRYADGHVVRTGRTDLFEELLDHRDHGTPLSSPLIGTGAYMEVLEAVRRAPDPIRIPDASITTAEDRVTVDDIAHWVERAARAGALFSEVHAPFAQIAPSGTTEDIAVDARIVAVRDDGSAVTPTSAPRPFLHPVRTLGGVVVTDAHPADHDWHLGASIGVQHANGVNFWGGPTYTEDFGYRWRADHGRIETTALTRTDDGFSATANWITPTGATLLIEETSWRVHSSPDPRAWRFVARTNLRALDEPVELGSPGTHGRVGGGYGGFAWRFPSASHVDVRTSDASGEEATHGAKSPWIAFSARFPDGEATVALAADDPRTASDPWFVRVADYPGIGSALAWEEPLLLDAGASVTLSFRGVVADGRLEDAEVAALLGAGA
ncbi:DUF6807 family protein [Microbacterium murale]|uniref:Dehydrogenase n=1 Tax=Microbacterium murale TaxID=1081040 RepID=A0ABU0P682_9MICO|nr:DUF6807 family protein [Microbacterium murale]MDQ0642833.1 putative dehydrogenase [Microbacterium murale]